MSSNREKINNIKKNQKVFDETISKKIIENFEFDLTNDQLKAIDEIKKDLSSRKKMFVFLFFKNHFLVIFWGIGFLCFFCYFFVFFVFVLDFFLGHFFGLFWDLF